MPPVAASEAGRAQTAHPRVCGVVDRHNQVSCQRKLLERSAEEGKSPVREGGEREAGIRSTTGHEEPCGKQGGPPSKAKDSMATDSA